MEPRTKVAAFPSVMRVPLGKRRSCPGRRLVLTVLLACSRLVSASASIVGPQHIRTNLGVPRASRAPLAYRHPRLVPRVAVCAAKNAYFYTRHVEHDNYKLEKVSLISPLILFPLYIKPEIK